MTVCCPGWIVPIRPKHVQVDEIY